MIGDFLKREDIKDLKTLQQMILTDDKNIEAWLSSKGYINEALKISTLCRTIKKFIYKRPKKEMRLKRLVSTLSEKNPKIERIYNEIFSKAFYLNEDYMCDDCDYHIDDIKQVLCDDNVAKMQD